MFRDLGDVIILVSVGTRPSEVAIIGDHHGLKDKLILNICLFGFFSLSEVVNPHIISDWGDILIIICDK